MRHLALIGVAVLLSLAACGGGAEETAGEPAPGACCKTTADLKAQMPNCCKRGDMECCKQAKSDPANKAECCKKAETLTAKMPECCKKHVAGTPQACCDKK
jgi:hypothetical protein